jgi:hypothetical protein
MRQTTRLTWPLGVALLAASLTTMSCRDTPTEMDHAAMHDAAQVSATTAKAAGSGNAALLKAVHAASARYHSTVQAAKAGYEVDNFCVAVPGLGGMGHHWVNGAKVDPVFNPTEPEVMLYAPDKHGNMKLVAVEYIVINVGQPRPTFGDHPMDIGGTPVPVPHWSLHVWVHQDNPSGVFAPFNPTVACPS